MKIQAIIFDFAGTLFESISQLSPGAKELLEFVKARGIRMGAVTAGTYDTTIINHLGLDEYMEQIQVVSDIGKSPQEFSNMIEKLGAKPETTVGIGDLRSKEIRCLNMVGATTIWIHHGNPGSESVNPDEHPDYAVKDLFEAKQIIEELLATE